MVSFLYALMLLTLLLLVLRFLLLELNVTLCLSESRSFTRLLLFNKISRNETVVRFAHYVVKLIWARFMFTLDMALSATDIK